MPSGFFRFLLSFASLFIGTSYDSCRSFPPPAQGDVIARDPRVQDAVAQVVKLLTEAAAKLPSGLVAAVVYDQTTLFSQGYGYRNLFNKSEGPPSTQDLLRVASITKLFTDILLYQLRDSGLVALDDPLTKYMPSFKMLPVPCESGGPSCRSRNVITLRTLASHTSGLPREVPYPCSWNHGSRCNESYVLELLSKQAPVLPPKRKFHYSNLGFGLLGRALGHATGYGLPNAYETLVTNNILVPLGMRNASFVFDDATRARRAVGTAPDGSRIDASKDWLPCDAGIAWEAPTGSLWASTDDIVELIKLFFRDDRPAANNTKQVLDGDSIHEMLEAVVLLEDGFSAVGSPWEMKYSSGVWIKSKQGQLPGYRSAVSIVEELKIGVFVSALVSDVDDLSVWTQPALEMMTPIFQSVLQELQAPPSMPKNHTMYLGRYIQLTPPCLSGIRAGIQEDDAVVTFDGSFLMLHRRGNPLLNLTAVPGMEHVFRAHVNRSPNDCLPSGAGENAELVYFEMAGGHAASLRFMDALYKRDDNEIIV